VEGDRIHEDFGALLGRTARQAADEDDQLAEEEGAA
jgi:hypothetical protein